MKALVLVLLFSSVGCVYGPEHLPDLYNGRDAHVRQVQAYEKMIFDIERKNGLASRGSVLTSHTPGPCYRCASLEDELQRYEDLRPQIKD